jgi:ribosomal protein S18 acetylase RimI-like enzyme
MFRVGKMKTQDFPFAVDLANTMNWNMVVADFELAAKLEPDGCFILSRDSRRLGIATCVSYGKVGWFGNLIVQEEQRRKGAGSLLLKHAINYLKDNEVETIGLYAYPNLIEFYNRFGFEPDMDFLVLQGKPSFSIKDVKLREATKQDIPALIEFDSQCFGASRKKLLEHILENKENLCYVSAAGDEVTGYVAAKVYGEMAEVGPLICPANHVDEAVLLLKTILSRLRGRSVFICIPKKETDLLAVLSNAGLQEDFRVARMFLGTAIVTDCIYVAESLERG